MAPAAGTIKLTAQITGGAAHLDRKVREAREAARTFIPLATHGWTPGAIAQVHPGRPSRSAWLIALREREQARLTRIDGWRASQTVRRSSRESAAKDGQTPDPRAPRHEHEQERSAPGVRRDNLTPEERARVERIRRKKNRQAGLLPATTASQPTTKTGISQGSDGTGQADQAAAVGQLGYGFRP